VRCRALRWWYVRQPTPVRGKPSGAEKSIGTVLYGINGAEEMVRGGSDVPWQQTARTAPTNLKNCQLLGAQQWCVVQMPASRPSVVGACGGVRCKCLNSAASQSAW